MTVNNITLALTGASGAQYGLRLLECLVKKDITVNLLVSKAARMVIGTETDWQLPNQTKALSSYLAERFQINANIINSYHQEEWIAPIASGTGAASAMVICPCSTGTLAAIANGNSDNLIERAADVSLKERRPLIIVPRETPYSLIHIENMLTLTRSGAIILPANPGFYHQPKTIDDLVDFVVARILNLLGVEQTLLPKWGNN